MSRELTKMNLIAIVQQLPEEDIEVIETYIKMIEDENEALKETINQLYKELNTSNMSEEEWLDYAINYNLEQLEKRIADEL